MKQLYRFNEEGFYVEPVISETEESFSYCTEVKPPDGLFKAKFVNGIWIEGLPKSEIESMRNQPQPMTIEERFEQKEKEIKRLQSQTELLNVDLAALMDALSESGVF